MFVYIVQLLLFLSKNFSGSHLVSSGSCRWAKITLPWLPGNQASMQSESGELSACGQEHALRMRLQREPAQEEALTNDPSAKRSSLLII